jgi:hypothetical protein
MQQILLSPVPNQSIAFNIDGAYWQIHVYTSIYFVCVDIVCNGNDVINGARAFAGIPLIPFAYLQAPFGNFIFDSDADWNNFQTTCNLYYLTANEFLEYNSTIKETLIYGNNNIAG